MQDHDDETRREGVRPIPVCAVVEEYDDRPDQCTIYPSSASGREERLTSWITATGDAFVDRRALR